MKIGIVTYHKTLNYGACLQAVATRLVLEQEGHNVFYVDYWPSYHKKMYEVWSWNNIRFRIKHPVKLVNYIVKNILYRNDVIKRKKNFESFFSSFIYPYCLGVNEKFDVVVYGSDQIWRKQAALKTYNPFYFGKNGLFTKKHVSYAASMGVLPDASKDKDVLKDLISHIDCIGVREEGLLSLVQNLGFSKAIRNIDPTLLLSSTIWDSILPSEEYKGEPYALIYTFEKNPFDMESIQRFAKEKSLNIKVINGYVLSKETDNNLTTCGPADFVRLIKYADYIFSGSFHGTVFSILYGKQVFASNFGNSERIKSLFDSLGITDRLLKPLQEIPGYLPPIDYEKVNTMLQIQRKTSYEFLINAIKLYENEKEFECNHSPS